MIRVLAICQEDPHHLLGGMGILVWGDRVRYNARGGVPMKWREIPGFTGYEVSDNGVVRSRRHGAGRGSRKMSGKWLVLKLRRKDQGYVEVALRKDGEYRYLLVHRLVLEVFVGPCPAGKECRHLNGNQSDNRLRNLEWGTKSENERDKTAHGTLQRGERNGLSALTEKDVRFIRSSTASGCALARRFGVSSSTIYAVRHAITWGWLS